ncbi:MAG TPA: outer membrane protein transport protein [Desulfomonilia bacterium]|nr:outer membrane protein transport protein [Desulfomonilia bacterium]
MNRVSVIAAATILALTVIHADAFATNGDNLIGIGPIARSMGGVGIAAPQDAISAVFANPASMCVGPFCPASSFDFAGTLFMPKVDAEVKHAASVAKDESARTVYTIPAIGISAPITDKLPLWRFGIAAYGVTGLGVDYRGGELDDAGYYDFGPGGTAPLVQGEYTQLQIMKFAPAVGVLVTDKLSLGMAVHIDYAMLDLRNGTSPDYTAGIQLGVIFMPTDAINLGLTYTSPQETVHDNVNLPNLDTLKLESPQQLGFGISYQVPDAMNLLVETDVKWLNWADATGYSDFDWKDQWVYAVGLQVEPKKNLFLRAGFNYSKNPVDEHDGFDGSFNPATGQPNSAVNVQGTIFPAYYYETFRIIGFPAIVEKHLTFGAGYRFTDQFSMNVGWMHAFEKTISESGTDPFGQPVSLESTLSEDSLDFGLTWVF